MASRTTVTWVKDKTFVGTDSTNHSVVISSMADGVGMKPSELLLSALGSCTAYDVVEILAKKRQKLTQLQVVVTAEQADATPAVFTKFHIHYIVAGVGLRTEDVAKAIELSEEKYCSVSATLKRGAEVTFDFEVHEDERL